MPMTGLYPGVYVRDPCVPPTGFPSFFIEKLSLCGFMLQWDYMNLYGHPSVVSSRVVSTTDSQRHRDSLYLCTCTWSQELARS